MPSPKSVELATIPKRTPVTVVDILADAPPIGFYPDGSPTPLPINWRNRAERRAHSRILGTHVPAAAMAPYRKGEVA